MSDPVNDSHTMSSGSSNHIIHRDSSPSTERGAQLMDMFTTQVRGFWITKKMYQDDPEAIRMYNCCEMGSTFDKGRSDRPANMPQGIRITYILSDDGSRVPSGLVSHLPDMASETRAQLTKYDDQSLHGHEHIIDWLESEITPFVKEYREKYPGNGGDFSQCINMKLLWTQPEFCKHGMAHSLVSDVISRSHESGNSIFVFSDTEAGHRLYRRMGFETFLEKTFEDEEGSPTIRAICYDPARVSQKDTPSAH
ncbi:uncharacterized protein I303_102204 [Kwoniella dejecticola CBS 10117]|uniref:N-acetyltransferase domain-containing protein n=1 Tax=Kwoniella dejecticola CBS 10117 TaxID=1296121 RepID=A0A1A6ABM5_9TREE|nr:uncharacterized protein I303_01655 [Kwoniella dejecticola CBS 10117]OBR87450.1 hypothetical protein I303_01655 [Kwoniella dejecticola CBS 10117]